MLVVHGSSRVLEEVHILGKDPPGAAGGFYVFKLADSDVLERPCLNDGTLKHGVHHAVREPVVRVYAELIKQVDLANKPTDVIGMWAIPG